MTLKSLSMVNYKSNISPLDAGEVGLLRDWRLLGERSTCSDFCHISGKLFPS